LDRAHRWTGIRDQLTWRYDTTVKFRKYEAARGAEVWLVDTASNTVLVYRRSTETSPEFDVALELGAGEQLVKRRGWMVSRSTSRRCFGTD
jgi:Putative restriction endonuclease